jgi:hypothetical protein
VIDYFWALSELIDGAKEARDNPNEIRMKLTAAEYHDSRLVALP